MLTLLAFLFVVAPQQTGSIHVVVEPNAAVFLDGHQVGISSPEAGGFVIEQVPLGAHDIVVRTSYGGAANAKVTVNIAQTSTVSISSLGLRTRTRGDDSTIELQVVTDRPTCDLQVGMDRVSGAPADLHVERVRPGPQHVTVACGDRQVTNDVDIPASKIVTIAADPARRTLRVVASRDRITTMYVPTVADSIMRMDLPFTWKRAVAASVVAGAHPKVIARGRYRPNSQIEAEFLFDTYGSMVAFVGQLRDRTEVSTVDYDYGWNRDNSLNAQFIITFKTLQ